jgi:hypothetical protein
MANTKTDQADFVVVSVRMLRSESEQLSRLAALHSRAKSAEAAYAIRLYFQSEATATLRRRARKGKRNV